MKKLITMFLSLFIICNFSYSQILKDFKLPKLLPTADYSYLSDNTMPLSTDSETKKMYLNSMSVNWNYLAFSDAQNMMDEVIKSDPIFAMAYAWKSFDSNLTEEKRLENMNKAIEYAHETVRKFHDTSSVIRQIKNIKWRG